MLMYINNNNNSNQILVSLRAYVTAKDQFQNEYEQRWNKEIKYD
jgi:hypothetical protein